MNDFQPLYDASSNLWLLSNRLIKCVEAWISRIIRKTWANTTLTKKMYSTWNMYYLLLHSGSKLPKMSHFTTSRAKRTRFFFKIKIQFWRLKNSIHHFWCGNSNETFLVIFTHCVLACKPTICNCNRNVTVTWTHISLFMRFWG